MSNAAEELDDARMGFLAGHIAPKVGEKHFIFIDFDKKTLAGSGDPGLIPVPLVTAILQQLAASSPSKVYPLSNPSSPWAVFLDLDLTYLPKGGPLEQLKRALLVLQERGIPVFLERELLREFPGHAAHFRVTPLSELVRASPTIAWFSADTHPSAQGVERHFPLAVIGTAGLDGPKEEVPSAALAALLLNRTDNESLAKRLLDFAFADPTEACPEAAGSKEAICFATKPPLRLIQQMYTVNYTMSWNKNDMIRPISAEKMFDAQGSALPGVPGAFAGDIVIIGSSAQDRGDLHQTALGVTPGAVILANMMRDWLVNDPQKTPSYLTGVPIVTGLALLLALSNYGVLSLIPERWHGHTRFVLSSIVSLVMLVLPYRRALPGGVDWLIALQFVSAYLVRSPNEKPGPIQFHLMRAWVRSRRKRHGGARFAKA